MDSKLSTRPMSELCQIRELIDSCYTEVPLSKKAERVKDFLIIKKYGSKLVKRICFELKIFLYTRKWPAAAEQAFTVG